MKDIKLLMVSNELGRVLAKQYMAKIPDQSSKIAIWAKTDGSLVRTIHFTIRVLDNYTIITNDIGVELSEDPRIIRYRQQHTYTLNALYCYINATHKKHLLGVITCN